MNNIKKLTPFKMQILTNFPYIEADFDAITNYELMCKVVEYLNKVIANENEVTDKVNNLQAAFIELQNYVNTYFDNLDIQTEVNNKLDEMAESGQLADMIAEYISLQGQLVYNSVADMKTAENIQNGSFLKTYGYYGYNDGGGALYKARTVTNEDDPDDKFIIALNDETLVAELIIDNLNIKQIGAYGDDEHDDIDTINYAIEYARDHDIYDIYIPNGTYKITKPIILYDYIKLIGTNKVKPIIHKTTNTEETIYNTDSIIVYTKRSTSSFSYCEGQVVNGLELKGNGSNTYGIYTDTSAPFSKVQNCTILNVNTCIYYKHGAWLFELSDLLLNPVNNGIKLMDRGTSLFLKNTYVISGDGIGYDFNGLGYSTITNICCDFHTGNPYKFNFCTLVVNGLGCEAPDATTSIVVWNSNIEINSAAIYGSTSASYVCIEGNGSFLKLNNATVTNSDGTDFAGKFINDQSNFTCELNYVKVNQKFLTDNTRYSATNLVKIANQFGTFENQPNGKLSGVGFLGNESQRSTSLTNGNCDYKMGGIYFNNYGNANIGYGNADRGWNNARKYGDIFVNQAPLKNGIAFIQQISDTEEHTFSSPITAVNIEGTSGTITLNNLTLDNDGEYKGIRLAWNRTITSSSGGSAKVSSVNFANNTISVTNVTGTFQVDDTITYPGIVYFRDSAFNYVQAIGYGSSADRPRTNLINGYMYWDTTLGKAIWYINGVWKDATGTNV